MADLERLPIVQNIEMPNQTTFRLPGDAIFSTSAVNTPNVERFEGDEQGVLEPSPDTLGTIYVVPTPLAGKGGTTVEWEQIVTSETAGAKKIATITIDNVPTDVYAIGGGGGSDIVWNQIQTDGEKMAEITIDGTKYDVMSDTLTEEQDVALRERLDNIPATNISLLSCCELYTPAANTTLTTNAQNILLNCNGNKYGDPDVFTLDKTTGTITVNKAGPYLVGCSAYFGEGFVPFDTMHVGAYINNNIDNLTHTLRKAPGTGTAAVNPYEVINAFGIRQLAVGDKITLQAYNQTASRGTVIGNSARNKLFLIKLTNS